MLLQRYDDHGNQFDAAACVGASVVVVVAATAPAAAVSVLVPGIWRKRKSGFRSAGGGPLARALSMIKGTLVGVVVMLHCYCSVCYTAILKYAFLVFMQQHCSQYNHYHQHCCYCRSLANNAIPAAPAATL